MRMNPDDLIRIHLKKSETIHRLEIGKYHGSDEE